MWFGNSADNEIPLYKTNLGYFNGSDNLRKFEFTDQDKKQLLEWKNNTIECIIGSYSC